MREWSSASREFEEFEEKEEETEDGGLLNWGSEDFEDNSDKDTKGCGCGGDDGGDDDEEGSE